MKKKEYISPAISVIEIAPATMIATSMKWTPTGKEEDGFGVFEEDEENSYNDDITKHNKRASRTP